MIQPIRPQDASGIYQRQSVQAADDAEAAGQRRAGSAREDASRRSDRVTVSSEARELHRVMGIVRSQGDVRTERVDRLRAEIESGGYQVDADFLARRLLEDGLGT